MFWYRGGRKQEKDDIQALERRCEGLESSMRLLKLEWETVFDKLGKTMGRLNARIRKSGLDSPPDDAPPPDDVQPALPSPSGTHARMEMHRGRR